MHFHQACYTTPQNRILKGEGPSSIELHCILHCIVPFSVLYLFMPPENTNFKCTYLCGFGCVVVNTLVNSTCYPEIITW